MQTKTQAIGGAGVVVLAIGAAMYLRPDETPVQSPNNIAVPANIATAAQVQPVDPVAARVMPLDEDPEPVVDVQAGSDQIAATGPETAAAPRVPEHSDFRFEPDGAWLVAGSAEPNLPLAVLVNGVEAGRVEVGADGTFLVTGFAGYSDTPRRLDLLGDPDGAALRGTRSFILNSNPAPLSDVAIAVTADPNAPQTEVAQVPFAADVAPDVPPMPARGIALNGAVESAAADPAPVINNGGTGQVSQSGDGLALRPVRPAAPVILSLGDAGVDVVQPAMAAGSAPEVMSTVALDTITYDPVGDVILSGRAPSEGFVQVYVDNAPVSRLPVGPDGTWRTDLPDVEQGIYVLRIDEVDADGAVVSRIETPFQREDPVDIAAAIADEVDNPDFSIATRTIQPGATLWAIAEERYGSGVLYVKVFEANRDRIRDPDLIYPGQVFVMPKDSN